MKNIILLLSLLITSQYLNAGNTLTYCIDVKHSAQTIRHFGASDAWSMQYLGLWQKEQQNQIADWLFSTENDKNGKPKGIGLSLWRFNLGAGSAEQGDKSQINEGTRTECLLKPDGTYDWDRQRGQRNFLKLAKERGVCNFLAFMNSAPVYFTANGLATNTGRGGSINLKPDAYGKFAEFAAKALKGIERKDSIHFNYFSPVNEPDGHWNWIGPKQEGSPATNEEVAKVARSMSQVFNKERLKTKITIDESSDLRCLIGVYMTNWNRGNSLSAFFSKDSTKTYVKDLSNIAPVIMAHSYWTNTPIDFMRSIREKLRDELKKYKAEYWQSEFCIMSNDEEIGGGNHYDFTMKTGLYVARVIHYDLVYGNACSWSWWRAAGGDYKDGLLRVYSNDGWKSGSVKDSKLLWCLGNFSRFIRPGAVRYYVTTYDPKGKIIKDGETEPYGIMASAYRNTDGTWVFVAINYDNKPRKIRIKGINGSWKMFRTSDKEGENLAPVGTGSSQTILSPKSITTFVMNND